MSELGSNTVIRQLGALIERATDRGAARAATSATTPATEPPTIRRWLRTSWPRIKLVLGFLFVTIGAGSSVAGFYADIQPLIQRLIADRLLSPGWPALTLGVSLGVVAALIIFWGEVLSAEHERWHWYLLFLIPDVRYTYRMFGYAIDAFGGSMAAMAVGFVGAVLVAHFGEQWLFGKRRTGWLKRLLLLQWGRV